MTLAILVHLAGAAERHVAGPDVRHERVDRMVGGGVVDPDGSKSFVIRSKGDRLVDMLYE